MNLQLEKYIVIIFSIISFIKAQSVILTHSADVTTRNGSVCPQEIKFTCVTSDVRITVLRWFNRTGEIEALRYTFSSEIRRPIVMNISNPTFILRINSATFSQVSQDSVDFNVTLIANTEELYGMGYHNISCGSFSIRDSFLFDRLDIEVPSSPRIVTVNLVYSMTSLIQLNFTTETMVYDQGTCRCEYRQSSKFNTSVTIDGRLINPETISDLNCSQGEFGVIPISNLPTIGNLSEVRVSITAVNRYGESSATVYNVDYVRSPIGLNISYMDCEIVAKCFFHQPLNSSHYTLRYGLTSSFEEGSITQRLNVPLTLRGLQDNTLYYLEAIVNASNGINRTYYTQHNFTTGTCASKTQIIHIVVPIVVVIVVVIVVLAALVILLCVHRSCHSKSGNLDMARKGNAIDDKDSSTEMWCDDGKSAEDTKDLPYNEEEKIEISSMHREYGEETNEVIDRQAEEDMQNV